MKRANFCLIWSATSNVYVSVLAHLLRCLHYFHQYDCHIRGTNLWVVIVGTSLVPQIGDTNLDRCTLWMATWKFSFLVFLHAFFLIRVSIVFQFLLLVDFLMLCDIFQQQVSEYLHWNCVENKKRHTSTQKTRRQKDNSKRRGKNTQEVEEMEERGDCVSAQPQKN